MKRLIDGEWLTLEECYDKHKKFITHLSKGHISKAIKVGLSPGDVRGAGNEGFIKAYNRYDNSQDASFISFAKFCINGEIRNSIRDYGAAVHYPRGIKELAGTIYSNDLDTLSTREIADNLQVEENDVQRAFQYSKGKFDHLDAPMNKGEMKEASLHEFVGRYDDISEMYLREFTENLNDRDKQIIFYKANDLTQGEVAEKVGLSQIHVSRRLRALKKKYKEVYNRELSEMR